MKRPLENRVQGDPGWVMRVQEAVHTSGVAYPVLEWTFSPQGDVSSGVLQFLSLPCTFTFQDSSAADELEFRSVEDALQKIDEHGWGEPPHIDEVFQDIRELQKHFPIQDLEAGREIFVELKRKWEEGLAWEKRLSGLDFEL